MSPSGKIPSASAPAWWRNASKGLSLPPRRASLAAAKELSTDQGDRRERRRDGVQMGWDAANSPGRGAEGDRPRDVWRGSGDARHAVGQNPALAARPCADPQDRHDKGGGIARGEGGGDRSRFSGPEIRIHGP